MSRGKAVLRVVLVGAVLVGLAAGRVALRDLPTLPPQAVDPADAPRLRGVFHVHSDSSHDGRTPAREQLEAAGRLELDFVIYAEHDTRPVHPSPPGGPLAVPGTEWSTTYGHLIYLGYEEPPPEGDARLRIGLVDSLRVRGALTIVAHPSSPRRAWVGRHAGIGGLEIASTSTDGRVKADPSVGIVPVLFALPLNPELALSQLYRRDPAALKIWDGLEDPSVIGICGTDAHGWIDAELNFRTWHVVFDPWADAPDPLTADAIVDQLATGRFACVAALLTEGAPRFAFVAATGSGPVHQGESVAAADVAAIEVQTPVPPGGAGGPADATTVTTVLLADGIEVARTDGATLRLPNPAPGTYRVEVRMRVPGVLYGGKEVPVLYSNRIAVTK